MDSIQQFILYKLKCYPNIAYKNVFGNFLTILLPTDLPVKYHFGTISGKINCSFHAIQEYMFRTTNTLIQYNKTIFENSNILKTLANHFQARIIILVYSSNMHFTSNHVQQFIPNDNDFSETIILLNFDNNITIVLPTKMNYEYALVHNSDDDTYIRKSIGDRLILNAIHSGIMNIF